MAQHTTRGTSRPLVPMTQVKKREKRRVEIVG
jgi:hypothetical protein